MHPAANARPTTKQRAIFLDFDGTYADHGVVPAGHVRAVHTVRAAGHLVFLCTGRPRSMVLSSVLAGLDGFVEAAGGYVELDGKVLADHRFPLELAVRMCRYSMITTWRTCWRRRMRCTAHLGSIVDWPPCSSVTCGPPTIPDREGPRDILDALRMSDDLTGASFSKITCFDSPVPVASIAEQVGPEVAALPSSIPDMGDSAGELCLSWIDKALGIQTVIDHLGIGRAQVVAIGDGLNDVEMLEFAGTAIAIEGSDPRLLGIADHVAAGPEQEGLVSIFVELGLLDAD